MRIAYFGGDMFHACLDLLIQNGHEIIVLFANMYNADEYDYSKKVLRQAEMLGIPILRSKPTNGDIMRLRREGCHMILAAGYQHKIPQWHGGGIRYGVNIHPSLLPEGGGPMPFPFVIIKGLEKTGVTLHKLSQDWDDGDIVIQEKIPLYGDENLEGLLHKSQTLAVKLLQSFLKSPEKLWDNASPQRRRPGDYWPLAAPKRFAVDYSKDINTVEKYLRAHRFISPDGMVEFVSNVSFWQQEHNHEPGTILSQENDIFLIAVADGLVNFKLEKKQIK